jgi:ATP-dependent Clp protease ATP-binding subunit ClpC
MLDEFGGRSAKSLEAILDGAIANGHGEMSFAAALLAVEDQGAALGDKVRSQIGTEQRLPQSRLQSEIELIIEDGQLTDGLGNTVDFKSAIIIMTSNIGARHLQKREGLGFQSTKEDMISDKVEDLVRNEVKRTFNLEFLNRLDEIILFSALTKNDLIQILELMVSQLNQNLAQKSITVTVTDEAKKWVLSQTLSDRSYGARPLRRALQKYVEDPLSEALIQGTIPTRPAFIEVFLEDNRLYYRPVDSKEAEGVLLYEN